MVETLNDRLDQLTHRLLHKQPGQVSVNAADITAGTFGANVGNGDFVFPAKLNVTGQAWFKGAATLFDNGLELANPSGTPYIDFHAEVDVNAADYDWRLIRQSDHMALAKSGGAFFESGAFRFYSDGTLHCAGIGLGQDNTDNLGIMILGGRITITSTLASNVVAKGSGAGYEFAPRDGTTGPWVWYSSTANQAKLWQGGDKITVYADRPSISLGDRNYIGYPGAYGGNYAVFCHWSYRDDANAYGYMQSNSGEVFLSSGTAVRMRINNTDKWWCDWNAVNLSNCRMVLNSNRIDTRGYGDDWHTMQWWSGNDGWRVTEYGGLYWRVRDQDPAVQINATGMTMFRKFDQLGAYDQSAIMTKSEGGGTGARIGFWSAGQNAAQILKCWGSTIEGRTWDDGGWGIINADLNDMSTEAGKASIQRVDKTGHKDKLKKLKPIKYVRKTDLDDRCVNCRGTGKALHPHRDELTEEVCPYCNGTKKKERDKAQKKNAETGFMSFSAEEMAVEFPEAVHFDLDENPVAIKPIALIAVLWEQVKDLQEQLDSLPATSLGQVKPKN